MNIDCPTFHSLVTQDFPDDSIDPLASHLEQCPACAGALDLWVKSPLVPTAVTPPPTPLNPIQILLSGALLMLVGVGGLFFIVTSQPPASSGTSHPRPLSFLEEPTVKFLDSGKLSFLSGVTPPPIPPTNEWSFLEGTPLRDTLSFIENHKEPYYE